MDAYLNLSACFHEVPAALERLAPRPARSFDGSPRMLEGRGGVERPRPSPAALLSVDAVKTYQAIARGDALGPRALGIHGRRTGLFRLVQWLDVAAQRRSAITSRGATARARPKRAGRAPADLVVTRLDELPL